MSEKNKAILEETNAAIAEGSNQGFLSFYADDTQWTFVDDKTLQEKAAVRQWMATTYVEPPKFGVTNLIAEGDFVTALGDITMKDKDGKAVHYSYCDVWRFHGQQPQSYFSGDNFMAGTSLQSNDDFKHFRSTAQVNSLDNSSVNHTFIAVAQEVVELIQQVYPVQTASINPTETLLTKRELEVLQLIADGHNNAAIAQRLYITMNTVKTHVHNILSKLYVNDRTQAVILGFRSGLVH